MKKYTFGLLVGLSLVCMGCTPCDSGSCKVPAEKPAAQKPADEKAAPEKADAAKEAAPAKDAEAKFKATLFTKFEPRLYTPDGMTVCEKSGRIYLNVPNFSLKDDKGKKKDSCQGGYLVELFKDGKYKVLLEYPILEKTGQTGPMGCDFGPDGHLYVCDNQYFYSKDYQSRILRVVMKDGNPTGEVQSVIEGIKLANAIVWYKDKMFYDDSALDTEDPKAEFNGAGAVMMFTQDEVLNAGKDGKPAIKVKPAKEDSHCVAFEKVRKMGRGDNTGADGMTVDTNTGVIYFGNFGNGQMYGLYPTAEGAYKKENVVTIYDPAKGEAKDGLPVFQCCDGIFFDKERNKVFINDSMCNAIRYFTPVAKGQMADIKVLASNGDTDGNDGSLDQPCECVVVDGKMIIANFDWTFPGLVNTKTDLPGTLSVIDISSLK